MNPIKKIHIHLNKLLFPSLIGLVAFSLAIPAWAGVFSVTPVRIYMTPKDRAIAVTITNDGDTELVMQADLYQWKQNPDGQDELTLTEDMFLAPPIIKMAPKSRQVVRLARLSPVKSGEQLSYRMIVREIPEAKPASEQLQLQIALAFSMPVFITPPNAKANLSCVVQRVAADTVNASCENTGNAHSHPTAFQINNNNGDKLASNETGGYILPNIKRNFSIKREGAAIPAGAAKLAVTLDDGTTVSYDVIIH